MVVIGGGRAAVNAPRIGVLALQGAFREHIQALTRLGAEPRPVRSPDELAGLDGVILPGGESTTIDKLLRKFSLEQPLRARIQAGMPVLATCAGLIVLADEVLDGLPDQQSLGVLPITVRRNAYGRQPDSFETDIEIDFLDQPFRAVFIRSPVIERVDDSVDIHATVGGRAVMVGDGQILGLTFHPELAGDDRIHQFFLANYVPSSQSGSNVSEDTG